MKTTQTKLTPEEKAGRIRRGYDASNRGDLAGYLDDFADDAVMHFIRGDVNGKQAIREFLTQQAQEFEEFRFEPHDVLASDEHVVALVSSTLRRQGQTYQSRLVHVFHLNDEGKTKEGWVFAEPETLKQVKQASGT